MFPLKFTQSSAAEIFSQIHPCTVHVSRWACSLMLISALLSLYYAFTFTPRLLWRYTYVHISSPAKWKKKKFKRKHYCKCTYFWISKVQPLQQWMCVQIFIDKRRTSNVVKSLYPCWDGGIKSIPRGYLDLLNGRIIHFVCALLFS